MASKVPQKSRNWINGSFLREWHTIYDVVFVLVVFVLLRVYNLLSIPIFADEAIYIRWSQVMRAVSSLRFLPLSDGKQPLFMWITIPFFKVFSDPLIAGRMVSVFCGLASLIGIFLIALTLFKNKKVALVAAFFYAVSPFTLFYDRMALVDSMLSMFIVWAMFFATLASKMRRLDYAMLTGFSLGGAWLTKSPAMIVLLILPITYLVSGLSLFHKRDYVSILKLVGLWLVTWIIAFGLYNILKLGPEFQMIALRNKDYIFGSDEILKHLLSPFLDHLHNVFVWYWLLLPGSILITSFVSIVFGFRKYWKEIVILLTWALVPMLVEAEIGKVFTPRYILFTLPPFFILAGLGIGKLLNVRKILYFTLLGIIVLPALWIDYLLLTSPQQAPLPREERSGYLEAWTSGYGIHDVADYIKSEKTINPNLKILVGTEGFFGTLPDGLMIYLSDIPGVVVKGVGKTINTVDDSLIQAKRAGDRVYLVVNPSRLKEDPENLGIKLINNYPKAVQPSGARESLLLFEVTDKAVKIFDDAKKEQSKDKK